MSRRIFVLAEEVPTLLPRFFDRLLTFKPAGTEFVAAAIEPSLPSPNGGLRYHLRLGGVGSLPRLAGQVAASARRGEPRSVAHVLRSHGVPVVSIASPNKEDFVAQLARLEPDLAFNAGARLLRPPVLAVPRLGWINRHAGRLPDYRGVAPVWWALYNQERSVAVTYHSMAKEVDGGEVLWEHEEAVDDSDTVGQLYERLLDHAVAGLWQAIDVLERGEGRPVDMTSGSYYHLPDRDEARAFRRRGLRYV